MAQCRGRNGGPLVNPLSPSTPQLEGPWGPSPISLLHSRDVSFRQQEGDNNERVTHPICVFEDGSKGRSSPLCRIKSMSRGGVIRLLDQIKT